MTSPRWTCTGCGRKVRAGTFENPKPPVGWAWIRGILYCSGCSFLSAPPRVGRKAS